MDSSTSQQNALYNDQLEKDFYIIAIGASAGGMEAIHLLFDHTPHDGAAYVIIQHLSPDHKSFMAELLAKHSKLKIIVAENNMEVEPDYVYLMPRGMNMTIKDRRLRLTEIQGTQRNTSIDIFFNSLAEDLENKSIGVILSGTGSDGTKGIAAIKKYGGLVIVQSPESAKFDGMPNSAIASGNADFILPPELIPNEIMAYLKRGKLENTIAEKTTEQDEVAIMEVLNLIQQNTPLDFTDYKRPTIIRRIVIRMTKNNIGTLPDYIDFIKANPSEINILAKEFLISVTKFFRDPEAYDIINENVIPEIIKNKLAIDTLKVWVVGCATGEEAYSLAILITEYLTAIKKNLEVKIFASDIDKEALHHASKGVYGENIKKDVSEERLNNFFIKQDDKYKVRENIRKMIIFAEHDIVKQPPYGKIDLISCRNLLIYLNPILQKKILSSLHFCLNLGGYLFSGPSESLGDLKKSFVEIDKKWKIYKSIEMVRIIQNATYSTPGFDKQMWKPALNFNSQKKESKNSLSECIHQTLLEESGYDAGICVDVDFKIIQTFGNFEKYLLPKIFNFNLLEMLPEELAIAASTTIRKAVDQNKKLVVTGVNTQRKEILYPVNVLIKPYFCENNQVETIILVLFREKKAKNRTHNEVEVFNMEGHTLRYLEDMKEAFRETKQKLKNTQEALETSYDNISSYNEELISSNEEMQSTNEELQSVNEELHTVNNEYQLKIKQLAELNDDLNNYFKGTINGQLYVDKDLIVRKFTPSAIKQINLKSTDVGRPLSDISTNIKFSSLIDDINNVIEASTAHEKEVQTNNGKWYQMMIIPYIKEQDNQKDGAIITFNDITELKKVQLKLSRINADHATFIYSVSHDLKGPLTNLSALIAILKDTVSQPSEVKEILDMTVKSVSNLTEIINELADITKIVNEIDEPSNIDINELLKEVELSLHELLVDSKTKIEYDLKEPEIPFSKKNLRSIVLNLLSNAIKYRSPDRTLEVTISTEKSDGFIILSLKDNGLGIPENKLKEIFTKFKRAHTHVEGSGVGLYLVNKIITKAGGKIEVESELGIGSVFKVYFKNKQ